MIYVWHQDDWCANEVWLFGVMDKIQADTALKAIYYKYLQGLKAMNQKTALFVVKNTLKRTVTNQENNSTNA